MCMCMHACVHVRVCMQGFKTRLERAGAPAFGMLVEVLREGRWRVHTHLAESVDVLLGGQLLERAAAFAPHAQLRELVVSGSAAAPEEGRDAHGEEDEEEGAHEAAGGSRWQGVVVRARFDTPLAAKRAVAGSSAA